MATTINKEGKKLSVRLTPDAAQKLQRLADEQGISLTAALQKAIVTEDFVRDQISAGGKIIVQKPDKTYTEVVFR